MSGDLWKVGGNEPLSTNLIRISREGPQEEAGFGCLRLQGNWASQVAQSVSVLGAALVGPLASQFSFPTVTHPAD